MTQIQLGPLVKGILTFVPGIRDILPSRNPGHTDSPSYCYGVWMKHWVLLHAHGMQTRPDKVAELGPGESVGVGLAALLSGANHYVGLDVAPYCEVERNLHILDGLLPMFSGKATPPHAGFPRFDQYLDTNLFASHLLPDEALAHTLAPERVNAIRTAIRDSTQSDPVSIQYKAPWSDPKIIEEDSVDLVISHSVLEHVVDLQSTYDALYRWLKPGGWSSHQIDLASHGLSKQWNGFRACSEVTWKMLMGRRLYMINRATASTHLRMMQNSGFEILHDQWFFRDDGIRREQLAPRWADISQDDLRCASLYVIARKRS